MPKFFIVALLLTITMNACTNDLLKGSGAVITQNRIVSNFTKVNTFGSTNIRIQHGSTLSVQAKGYDNLLAYLETKVINNTLEVQFRDNVNVRNNNTEVLIVLPLLEAISSNGSADIEVLGTFPMVASLDALITGSGNIRFDTGQVQLITATINGSGNISAFGLTAHTGIVTIHGSGTIEVQTSNKLKCTISGSGTIFYKGQPIIESNIMGNGQLVHK